jgi:sulfur-oxidizing protein SoxY
MLARATRNRTHVRPRRAFIVTLGAFALVFRAPRAHATPAQMQEAVRKVVGDAKIQRGKVKLDLPPLIDNGNVVALAVAVESPMTPSDHVKAIHVFNEKNPQPNLISVYLGPRAGRARIFARVRLADSQTITAIAQLSDGSFWQDTQDVIVTTAACAEELAT